MGANIFYFNFGMGYVFINWGINLDIIIFPTRLMTFLNLRIKIKYF